MQPPCRSRLCAAAGVRERQTPDGLHTPPAPAHEHPQPLRSAVVYSTSSCKLHKWACSDIWLSLSKCHSQSSSLQAHMQGRRMAAKSALEWVP